MNHFFPRSIVCFSLTLALLVCSLPVGVSAYDDYPVTWVNSGDQRRDIIEIAKTQFGYAETDGDHVKYTEWYFDDDTASYPWCSIFISWCAAQADIDQSILPKNKAAIGWTVETMNDNPFGGTPFTIDQQAPQPGDILFTRTNPDTTASSHCALVVAVDDTYIYTVEGNTGKPGSVCDRKYTRNGGYEVINNIPSTTYYILFATRPNYVTDQSVTDYYPSDDSPFIDVYNPTHYYYTPVVWAAENQIAAGITKTAFCPEQACTRCQVVTFLWRAAGKPIPETTDCPFTDVNSGAYYYNAVLWAAENGITNGTSADTFSPDQTCTRSQIAAFLWRAAGTPIPETTDCPFTDVNSGAYYYNAVLWAAENGITNGTSADTFSPEQSCTRGQIVSFLYRKAHPTV